MYAPDKEEYKETIRQLHEDGELMRENGLHELKGMMKSAKVFLKYMKR